MIIKSINPFAASCQFGQHEMMIKISEMIETMANGYSSESTR